jgi:hypothetical protein
VRKGLISALTLRKSLLKEAQFLFFFGVYLALNLSLSAKMGTVYVLLITTAAASKAKFVLQFVSFLATRQFSRFFDLRL